MVLNTLEEYQKPSQSTTANIHLTVAQSLLLTSMHKITLVHTD